MWGAFGPKIKKLIEHMGVKWSYKFLFIFHIQVKGLHCGRNPSSPCDSNSEESRPNCRILIFVSTSQFHIQVKQKASNGETSLF